MVSGSSGVFACVRRVRYEDDSRRVLELKIIYSFQIIRNNDIRSFDKFSSFVVDRKFFYKTFIFEKKTFLLPNIIHS